MNRRARGFGQYAVGLASLAAVSCGGVLTPLSPTAMANTARMSDVQSGGVAETRLRVMQGTVGPLRTDAPPCWANLYPCEVFDFATAQEGPIEVVLTWDGPPRALMVQLYWAGEGLAHEDIAPSGGPSRIAFLRPRMEAAAYRLRVVSRDPSAAIPFTLRVSW